MIPNVNLPKDMLQFLESEFGQVCDVQPLRGVAGGKSSTLLLRFRDACSVVKSSPSSRERLFYERYAPTLRGSGVPIPNLYWSGLDVQETNWIAIEEIPNALPKEQWICNGEQLKILWNLHSHDMLAAERDVWYRPSWDDELTELALQWYKGTTHVDGVKRLLQYVQQASQVLFVPTCSLSGDPNPTNWRTRLHGELVMLDWERFCQGSPAIDLAITIPNFGTQDLSLETKMARNYLRLNDGATVANLPSEASLAAQIRLAKVWTMVEFVANAAKEAMNYPRETVDSIVRELPMILGGLSGVQSD